MRPQYVALNNLDDETSHSQQHFTRLAPSTYPTISQIPRKWLALGATAVLCLIVYFTIQPSASNSETISTPAHFMPNSVPLLGQDEDATRLWFPAASKSENSFYPSVAARNRQTPLEQTPRTPLFIGFTRNNDMLIQAILSFVSAGWPRSDIIVVDNSGTMDANSRGLLTRANPFFLDYDLLRNRYGISVVQTPTLLSFSQLQNFFLRTAMAHGFPFYFWSHMDIAVLSDEAASNYKSFHSRVLEILAELGVTGSDMSKVHLGSDWALKYFTYDWLTLINVEAWRKIGSWDPFIPYYASDCDAYSRLALHGFSKEDVRAGPIFDLASILPNPEEQFFPGSMEEPLNSERYQKLHQSLEEMMASKKLGHRNEWQAGHGDDGKGEAWTYDPKGFQKLWWATAEFGQKMYKKKWGTTDCRLDEKGLSLADEFSHLP